MGRVLTIAVAFGLALAAATAPAAPVPKGAGGGGWSEYFPLTKGTKWVYRVGESEVTVLVAGTARLGGEDCARVETTASPDQTTSELYAVRADGVYRVQSRDDKLDPPVKVLPLPIKDDASWTVESKVADQTLKGTVAVNGLREKVKTPAGEFEAMLVESTDLKIGETAAKMRIWFARGRGIVRQEFTIAGREITIELTKFTPAGVATAPPPRARP